MVTIIDRIEDIQTYNIVLARVGLSSGAIKTVILPYFGED